MHPISPKGDSMTKKIQPMREIEMEIGRAGLISNMDKMESSFGGDMFTHSREIILFRYPPKAGMKL